MVQAIKHYKTEGEFKQDAAKWLRERYGRNIWFYPPSDRFYKGLPEFVICFYGRFVAPELKLRDTYDPQPLQKVNARRIQEADGIAFVSRTMEEFKTSMERIREIIGK